MKSIVSLIFGGSLITASLFAQNMANNRPRILDEVSVVTSTAEDMVTDISTRELSVMENSMNDYSSAIWSRDIYRQISDVEGNETFFYPRESNDRNVNLFSLLINLLRTNTINAYKYEAQPELSALLTAKETLKEAAIPFTEASDKTLNVKKENIPSGKITHYLVKERWYFDSKTSKGDIRVTHICPVLSEKNKYFPLFWVRFDDVSVYLARAASPVSVANVAPALTNVPMFDIIRNRWYRGCIYQVGMRQLSAHFPEMEALIDERKRIENELDYIQSRFYAAERRR
ncbi:MAG: gliding motility protein GldN [Prevotella sp.]|jgi:gliding motility associated protien GldN|nr:gliding motility protein GldN [Prevotella sp.]